jgi:hypothetical protein
MKPIKSITVHPELNNSVRTDVAEWCTTAFREVYDRSDAQPPAAYDYKPSPQEVSNEHEEGWRWYITSNYTRSADGTFDVAFKHMKDAHWFIIRWGGNVVEVTYEDVPEIYQVNTTHFDRLFA